MSKKKNRKKQKKQPLILSEFDDAITSWNSPEYLAFKKGKIWKLVAILGVVVGAALGFWYGAWTFSLAILVFAVVYYIVHLEKPKFRKIIISKYGIKMGGKAYPYNRIKEFWIVHHPPFVKMLYFRVKGSLLEQKILLTTENSDLIRKYLKTKIIELEGKQEPFVDTLQRVLKL